MAGGVYAVARGIFDHPIFAQEPFTEREAWLWMVENAAWKATRVRVRHGMQDLARGQLAYSTRFLGTRWQWPEARVRRYLIRLKIDAMIDAQSDARATLITICNYNKYQSWGKVADAQDDAQSDARATQIRRREEISSSLRSEDTPLANQVDEAFEAYACVAKTAGLATVRAVTDARRRKMEALLAKHGELVWREALGKVSASPFCQGKNDRGWRIDLDFLLTPSSFIKVLEGKYDPPAPNARGSPPKTAADLARQLSTEPRHERAIENFGNDRAAAQQLPSPPRRIC